MADLPEILTDLGNYELWRGQMLNYLQAMGLIGGLQGFDANSGLSKAQKNVRRERAFLAIKGRLGDEVMGQVAGLKTAIVLWNKLDALYKKQSLMQRNETRNGIEAVIQAMVIEMRKLETQILQVRNDLHKLSLKLEGLMGDHVQLTSEIAERNMEHLTAMVHDGNIPEEQISGLGRSIKLMVELALPDRKVAIQQQFYSAYQKVKDEFSTAVVPWQLVEGHLGFDIATWASAPAQAQAQPVAAPQDHKIIHDHLR